MNIKGGLLARPSTIQTKAPKLQTPIPFKVRARGVGWPGPSSHWFGKSNRLVVLALRPIHSFILPVGRDGRGSGGDSRGGSGSCGSGGSATVKSRVGVAGMVMKMNLLVPQLLSCKPGMGLMQLLLGFSFPGFSTLFCYLFLFLCFCRCFL